MALSRELAELGLSLAVVAVKVWKNDRSWDINYRMGRVGGGGVDCDSQGLEGGGEGGGVQCDSFCERLRRNNVMFGW